MYSINLIAPFSGSYITSFLPRFLIILREVDKEFIVQAFYQKLGRSRLLNGKMNDFGDLQNHVLRFGRGC